MPKLRKKIYPRTPSDFGAFLFVLVMIPTTYWFEIFVVLPSMYLEGSFWHTVHFIGGTFLMVNITSNFLAVIVTDTSSVDVLEPTVIMEHHWRLCSVCEKLSPPRSWHCNVCKTCILKRDHHCMFTGCCIGHYNYRYFCMFVIYLFIATMYSTYFNNYFMYSKIDFRTPLTLLKLIFPVAIAAFGFDASDNQYYLIVYLINLIGMLFTCGLIFIHWGLVRAGTTTYEKNNKIKDYDVGLKGNIKEVFGEKWYIAWIFPFIQSELPHDGICWYRSSNSLKQK